MPATQLSARLGVLQTEVDAALEEMAQTRVVARLWRKDHTLWKPEPREIENRLGWLTVAEEMRSEERRVGKSVELGSRRRTATKNSRMRTTENAPLTLQTKWTELAVIIVCQVLYF